jgi:serine/threonine-protein kinase
LAAGDLEHLGPRSDVYSLGATLYCLLTGRAPFEGDDLGAILRGVQAADFPAPRALDPTIDRALEAVCLKAMALKPEDRYATPRALAEDVERWKADEPVAAWREPFSRRTRRWVRRHRTLVTAAAAVLVMALAGLGAVAGVQARANRDLAAKNRELATEKSRVQERFELAMEAIGKFHSGVSEDLLLKRSEFKELRERLLREAKQYYDKLLGLLKDQPDAPSRRALGRAYYQLGGLLGDIRTKEDALTAYRQATAVQHELAAQPGADEEIVLDCLDSLFATADCLFQMGRYDDAMTSAKEGLRLAQTPPDSRDRRYNQSRIHGITGVIQGVTNRWSEALASFQRSLGLVEAELARAEPADQANTARFRIPIWEFRLGQAASWDCIGAAHEGLGHLSDALSYRLQGLKLFKELAQEQPNNIKILQWLHSSHFQVGREYQFNHRPEEALAAFREAEKVLKHMIATAPNELRLQRDLSAAQFHIACNLVTLGHREQALAVFEEGIRRCKAVAQADPSNVYFFQNSLVQYLHEYGSLLEEMGRQQEALANYEEAQAIIDRVLREVNPSEAIFRFHRGWNADLIGQLYLKTTGRLDTARVAFDRVIATWEGLIQAFPDDPDYRLRLASGLALRGLARARSGHPAGAIDDRRRAIAILDGLPARTSDELYDLARVHALLGAFAPAPGSGMSAAEAPSELDRAMTALRAAVAAGYRDLAHIRTDTDLDVLRSRPDFQLLMMDLAFPDEPFAH